MSRLQDAKLMETLGRSLRQEIMSSKDFLIFFIFMVSKEAIKHVSTERFGAASWGVLGADLHG